MTRDRQLDLFGDAHAHVARERAARAPGPDRGDVELAARLPAHVRFGTTSWTFAGWAGTVYRRTYASTKEFVRESLAEYARFPLVRTVGIDRSFYAPVAEEELADYRAQVPDGFECCSKVWTGVAAPVEEREGADGALDVRPSPTFLDPELFLETVVAPSVRGLGDALGPFVLQLPPSRGRLAPAELERKLERFLEAVSADLRIAVELRETRLFTDRYLAILRAHGATHCASYHPRMPPLGEQLARIQPFHAPFLVSRLLLPPGGRYDDLVRAYSPFDRIADVRHDMRADVVRLVRATGERGVETYVLVNNKVEGSSPLTIRALALLVAEG